MATKPKPKSSFGIDADPAEFNIEEWLSGASLPARTVKIYRDAGLRAQYDALEQKFLLMQSQVNLDDDTKDEALGVPDDLAELHDVAKQLQKLLARLEESALPVKVRALTHDEDKKIVESKVKGDKAAYERLAVAVIYPKLSPAEWAQVREAIGEVQFGEICSALSELAGFTSGGQVMPDFSPGLSALRSTKES